MSISALRPTTALPGVVVAVLAAPYDFKNEQTGEDVKGTSYRLHVAETDAQGAVTGVHELRVKQTMGPKLTKLVSFGDPVVVDCTGFAKQRGKSTYIEWTAEVVTRTDSGETLAA